MLKDPFLLILGLVACNVKLAPTLCFQLLLKIQNSTLGSLSLDSSRKLQLCCLPAGFLFSRPNSFLVYLLDATESICPTVANSLPLRFHLPLSFNGLSVNLCATMMVGTALHTAFHLADCLSQQR